MLSLKLSAVQRAQVFKTAPDLCVMVKLHFFCFPYSSLWISSNLTAGQGWWTARHIHPFPLLAVVTSLAILSGCILAGWPIFINTSLSHLQARCSTALRDMEGRSAVYQASVPSMSLVEVATAWALFFRHTNKHTRTHSYICWIIKTCCSFAWMKIQAWNLPCTSHCFWKLITLRIPLFAHKRLFVYSHHPGLFWKVSFVILLSQNKSLPFFFHMHPCSKMTIVMVTFGSLIEESIHLANNLPSPIQVESSDYPLFMLNLFIYNSSC